MPASLLVLGRGTTFFLICFVVVATRLGNGLVTFWWVLWWPPPWWPSGGPRNKCLCLVLVSKLFSCFFGARIFWQRF